MKKTIISKKLKKINNYYSNINSGGCAVFAVELYKVFKKLGLSPKIYTLTNSSPKRHIKYKKYFKAQNNFNLTSMNTKNIFYNHVIIEAGGVVFDSTGVHKSIEEIKNKWDLYYAVRYSFKDMKTLANCTGWNNSFDRRQIPFIKKSLKEEFNYNK